MLSVGQCTRVSLVSFFYVSAGMKKSSAVCTWKEKRCRSGKRRRINTRLRRARTASRFLLSPTKVCECEEQLAQGRLFKVRLDMYKSVTVILLRCHTSGVLQRNSRIPHEECPSFWSPQQASISIMDQNSTACNGFL